MLIRNLFIGFQGTNWLHPKKTSSEKLKTECECTVAVQKVKCGDRTAAGAP